MAHLTSDLSCIEINPDKTPVGSIILLHGLGADGNDFVPIVAQLQALTGLPLRFVFPNAPVLAVTINQGYQMPAWYDIKSFDLIDHADKPGILRSVASIKRVIAMEQQRMESHRIVLAGFSQGAVVALSTHLYIEEALGGVMALSGYLPYAEEVIQQSKMLHKSTPIFIGHGLQDSVVPYFLGNNASNLLKKNGFNVEEHTYPMAHSVCEAEIKDISVWLQKIFHPTAFNP